MGTVHFTEKRLVTVRMRIFTGQLTCNLLCTSIRMKKRDLFTCDRVDRAIVLRFLNNKHLLELVKVKNTMTEQEQLLSHRFIMCSVLYQNAQTVPCV